MGCVASIEESVIAKLEEKFGTKPELDDGLAYIGVDSIGMAELTVELEKDFGIEVDDDIVTSETVQELVDYIRERQNSSPSQ